MFGHRIPLLFPAALGISLFNLNRMPANGRDISLQTAVKSAQIKQKQTDFMNRPAAQIFAVIKKPYPGPADPIGFYAKGCLAGAQIMPQSSAYWQILYPERNRYWGHPVMIAFLQNLAKKGRKKGWHGLLIGDIAQARGGPLPFGHSSHQTGLDADIWFTPMPEGKLSASARQKMHKNSVLKKNSTEVNPKKWSEAHTELLKLAAEDDRTERLFIHPAIKKYLCTYVQGDKTWLHKMRPYWGHFEHFHVRLKCPYGAKNCQIQTPPPQGTGCDNSLNWWFSADALNSKKPKSALKRKKATNKQPKIISVGDLPHPCKILLK